MNFGEVVKIEILGKFIKEPALKMAFLAGLIRGSGAIYMKDGETGLMFSVSEESTLSLAEEYFRSPFSYKFGEVSVEEDRLNKKDRFTISLSGERAAEILCELGILEKSPRGYSVSFDFYGKVAETEEGFRAFLRGLFVSAGGCTVPGGGEGKGTGYHLELVFYHPRPAGRTSEKLAEYGIKTRITRRKESYLVYIKSAEEIKDFIAFLHAPIAVLRLTDLMIERELVNDSNRRKNCDLGNVTRQVEASMRLAEDIEFLDKSGRLSELKPELAETALFRKNYPEDTFSELAKRLSITKSCLNHRLRKIAAEAEKLKTETPAEEK